MTDLRRQILVDAIDSTHACDAEAQMLGASSNGRLSSASKDDLSATPVERLMTLCDPGTFRPLRTEATSLRLADRAVSGDGVFVGWGNVEGRPVCCYAQDPSFLGGSLGEAQAESILRLMHIAERARAPVVGVVESAGARLHEGLAGLAGYGRIFRETVRLSVVVPQIAVIGGTSAGGSSYSSALMDVVIATKQARMFLTGPGVVRQAVGEVVDAESLGGPRVHSKNGVANFVADDMDAALAVARELVNLLGEPESGSHIRTSPAEDAPGADDVLPPDASKPYDIRRLIETLVDRGVFLELSSHWARNIVTGFGRIDGRTVGWVANQPGYLGGLLNVPACEKGTWFVDLCERRGVPLVVLVDTPGFMPGTKQESAGIIRHGASLVRAFACATVPRVTVVVRKAYGGAFITMNSKHLGADLVLAWPEAEIGIMGARQAAQIMHRRELADGAGSDRLDERSNEYADSHMRPAIAAGCGVIDEIVPPSQTRAYLEGALGMLCRRSSPSPSVTGVHAHQAAQA